MKKSQNGFGAVEALLIVVLIGLVAGTGWYVIHSSQKADQTYSQTNNSVPVPATKKATTSPSASTKSATVNPNDAIIYQDDGGKLYQISLLASTEDQKQLAKAIDSYCQTTDKVGMDSVGATGVPDLFTNSTNTIITSTSASINMSCYDKNSKDVPWGDAARYVFVKDNSVWKFKSVSQGQ